MAKRRTLIERCKSTLAGQKARAKKKYGVSLAYTADDLLAIVPAACIYCEKRLTPSILNFDHRTPVSRGGDWSLANLDCICGGCNRKKGALTAFEYHALLSVLDKLVLSTGSDFIKKNVLARMAAGGAYIHG